MERSANVDIKIALGELTRAIGDLEVRVFNLHAQQQALIDCKIWYK